MKTLNSLIIFSILFISTHVYAANDRALRPVAQSVSNEQRVALVIGNSDYLNSPLANPVNDAHDMAAQLRNLGFQVVVRTNLKTKQIGSTLREFRSKLSPGAVALVFYAGHGLQIKGDNFLPAVDADINSEEDVPNQSLSVKQIMDVLEESRTRLNLVFLDACRNNPYASRSFRSTDRGLARVSAPSGTLISYATRPGSVAADGTGRNGLYTSKLLAQMASTAPIEQSLKRVVSAVKSASQGKQEPWMEGSIEGDFCFGGCADTAAPNQQIAYIPPSPPPVQVEPLINSDDPEAILWNEVKTTNTREDYQTYLQTYPKGKFVALAKSRIKKLEEDAGNQKLQQEQQAWQAAEQTGTESAYQSYLSTYPQGRYIAIAQVKMRKLQAETPQAGRAFKDCADCPELVVVPAGSFNMGSPSYETGRGGDEGPVHSVNVKAFLMDKTHISRGQFSAFVNTTGYDAGNKCWVFEGAWKERDGANWRNPGYSQQDNHPVACINWNDAQAYADWLSRKTGKQYRLPTEAEWEYAARAGTTTARYWGDSPDPACGYANVGDQTLKSQVSGVTWETHNCNDGYAYTAPVASFKPNAFGLYDMQGNLWQWTADSYHENYNGAPTDGNEWQGDGAKRVLRGGSWFNSPQLVRAAYRSSGGPAFRLYGNGFRLARTLP